MELDVGVCLVFALFLAWVIWTIVYWKYYKKNDDKKNALIIGTEYQADKYKKKILVECGQEVSVVYFHAERSSIWICRNCEAENEIKRENCCVCYQRR